MASLVLMLLALSPGLPFIPFTVIAAMLAFVAYIIPVKRAEHVAREKAKVDETEANALAEEKQSVRQSLKVAEIEVCLGKQLSSTLLPAHGQLAGRVVKMRRKFAEQYGFVVPEIRLTDDFRIPPKDYVIRMSGTVVAQGTLRPGEVLVVTGDGRLPDVPGLEETKEPAFGMKAVWIPEIVVDRVRRDGFKPVDVQSVLLTHLAETIRNNLSQLLSYKDVRRLLDGLEPEYKRLLEEIVPALISYSGLQAVLKLLLAERVSIRNLHLIMEAVAEILPHARRPEQIAEHVRMRLATQICGELSENNVLSVLRLGARWELAFHQAIKRDAKGDVVEFDIDPRLIDQFGTEAGKVVRGFMDSGQRFGLVVAPESRPFVRMITERLFATLPVLSHAEIARGVQIRALGNIS
jgi:flagellar biosynthesis protein FlhA